MSRRRDRHMSLIGVLFFGIASLQIYIGTFFPEIPAFIIIMLAGLFTMPLIIEVEIGKAIAQFVLTTLFAILTSGLPVIAPYALLFGVYPFLKGFLEDLPDKLTGMLWKFALACLMLAISALAFPDPFFLAWTNTLPVAAVIMILLGAFSIYDLLLTAFAWFYDAMLAPILN